MSSDDKLEIDNRCDIMTITHVDELEIAVLLGRTGCRGKELLAKALFALREERQKVAARDERIKTLDKQLERYTRGKI